VLAGALVAGALAFLVPHLLAQAGAPPQGAPAKTPLAGSGGNELVEALKATRGCLGVETAFTQSRKAVILAWFKDKDAVLDWYASDYHQTAMMGLREAAAAAESAPTKEGTPKEGPAGTSANAAYEEHEPLEFVPDDVGPILCIATITPSLKQAVPGFNQAISQISIELYAPLPGGIAFNGTLAPAALKVPHMIEMSDAPAPVPSVPAAGGGQR
jgi:uncharacterized protein (DUF1330 family)